MPRRTTVLPLILIGVLGLGAVGTPRAADAQPAVGKVPRIGYLSFRPGPSPWDEAFRQGLRELGWIEGSNITVEYRWAAWGHDRLAALLEELVRLKVDLLVTTGGTTPALAAKLATTTIPTVFTAGDPVGGGLVASLARPGGNLTGVSVLTTQLNGKRLGLLKEVVPKIARVAILSSLSVANLEGQLQDARAAASSLGVQLQVVEARDLQGLDQAFSVAMRSGALLVLPSPQFLDQRETIVGLAMQHRLPAIYEWREFVEAGGLMSYGANIAELYRRLAVYVDKILKGARPADIPVEQPTTLELAVNLRTAKALGLTIPQSVLVRADAVIQ